MFRFYSNPSEAKTRVSVVGEYSEGVLKIAVARCSEKDHFVRKKGRMIAEGRLAKGKTYEEIPLAECDIQEFVRVAKSISKEVTKTKQIY